MKFLVYCDETLPDLFTTTKPIVTFDDIPAFFPKDKFSHAFYESSDRRGLKDLFSQERSKRIDWIRLTLENSEALLFQGWDSKKKCYQADNSIGKIKNSPFWNKEKCMEELQK